MDTTGTQGRHKSNAKDDLARALADVKLIENIVAVQQDAERKLRVAENAKAEADAYSAKMRQAADNYGRVVRQDADNYAARVREEIDAVRAEVEEAKRCTLTVQAELKQNKAKLDKLIAENTEKQRALDAKTAKIKTALLELKRDLGDDGDRLSVPLAEGELQAINC